jgi:hypothetical protein
VLAFCVTEAVPAAQVGEAAWSSTRQLVGSELLVPIPSKFWVTAVVLVILICALTLLAEITHKNNTIICVKIFFRIFI